MDTWKQFKYPDIIVKTSVYFITIISKRKIINICFNEYQKNQLKVNLKVL